MVHSILIALFAIFIFYVAQVTRQYHALRQFGGHWSVGWSRLWLLRTQGSGEMHKHFTAINKKYGKFTYPFGQPPPVTPPPSSSEPGILLRREQRFVDRVTPNCLTMPIWQMHFFILCSR